MVSDFIVFEILSLGSLYDPVPCLTPVLDPVPLRANTDSHDHVGRQ